MKRFLISLAAVLAAVFCAESRAIWEYARSLPYVSGIGFLGHSQGGVAASMTAGLPGHGLGAHTGPTLCRVWSKTAFFAHIGPAK